MKVFHITWLFILLINFLFSLEMDKIIDTDGDGYSDDIEIQVGTDPNNKADRYYYGFWPYNPNKDKIKGASIPTICPNNISCECSEDSDCINGNCQQTLKGEFYCTPKPGDVFPNLITIDQYGEFVDIYDFALQGKIIVLEFGAAWCAPCQDLASWLSSGDQKITSNRWWKKEYSIIKEKVDKDEIIFITILFQTELRNNMNYEAVVDWHEKYPNNKIPILADEYKDIHQWIKPTGYPCINLLDQNMRLITFTGRGLTEAFDMLSGLEPFPELK